MTLIANFTTAACALFFGAMALTYAAANDWFATAIATGIFAAWCSGWYMYSERRRIRLY